MWALTTILLVFPGTSVDSLWRLNPEAHLAFHSLGRWSILLMLGVGTACAFAAIGLWNDAIWGTRLAIGILCANVVGDLVNVVARSDYRALIGLPIGGLMIFYLVRTQTRDSSR